MILTRDKWRGNKNDEEVTESPEWDQVEVAIRELDQRERTLVTIQRSQEHYIAVGGGAGVYVAYVAVDGPTFDRLAEAEGADGSTTLVVGGQASEYPKDECVSLTTVLLAVRTFVETGLLEPGLRWKAD